MWRWWRHVAQSRPRQLRVVDGSSAASSVPPSEMARERHELLVQCSVTKSAYGPWTGMIFFLVGLQF